MMYRYVSCILVFHHYHQVWYSNDIIIGLGWAVQHNYQWMNDIARTYSSSNSHNHVNFHERAVYNIIILSDIIGYAINMIGYKKYNNIIVCTYIVVWVWWLLSYNKNDCAHKNYYRSAVSVLLEWNSQ